MGEREDETALHSATSRHRSHYSGFLKKGGESSAGFWGIQEDTILSFVYLIVFILFVIGVDYYDRHQTFRRERREATQKLTEARSWPLQARSDFLDPNAKWPVTNSDRPLAKINRSLSAGRYRWQVEAHKGSSLWTRGPWVNSDFLVEVRIRRIGGSPDVMAGLVFGEQRTDDFFSALLTEDRLFFRAEGLRETREIEDDVPGLGPDFNRKLTIVVQKGISRFYLDDNYVGQSEVPPLIRGTVGLMVSVPDQQKVNVEFVDFRLRALPAPPLETIEMWPITFWDSFSFADKFWRSGKWPVGGFQNQNIEGSRSLSKGKYLWRVHASHTPGVSHTDPDLVFHRDFMASVDTHLIEGSKDAALGLAMGCLEQNEVHFLQLTGEGKMRLGFRREPEPPLYQSWRKVPVLGSPSTLAVVVTGKLATFFVNQAYVGHVSHHCTAPYRIGLLLELMEEGDNAFYTLNNFQVREPRREE